MEVKINEKVFNLKELKYKDLTSLADVSKPEIAEKMIILSTGMTKEEYENLSMREGIELQKKINELNGLGEDFQQPLA